MPYVILKKGPGYKVCKKSDHSVCFSKKPLPHKRAEDQREAILANKSVDESVDERPVEWWSKMDLNFHTDGNGVDVNFYENNPKVPTLTLHYTKDPHGLSGFNMEDPVKVNGKTFNDPQEAANAGTLSFEDIEHASQVGYKELEKKHDGAGESEAYEMPPDKPHTESLSFEALFNSLMQ